jgi:hypothetical protein
MKEFMQQLIAKGLYVTVVKSLTRQVFPKATDKEIDDLYNSLVSPTALPDTKTFISPFGKL